MIAAPQISVIMPVYNAERYVAEAVESILAQTFTDFEFLIIDDGSTDGSLEILQKYADEDPRIRLKSRPNTGYVVALNEMLADARGEFIARMDADDISVPFRFESQVAFMQREPSVCAIGSGVELIDPNGLKLTTMQLPPTHREIDAHNLQGRSSAICHPSTLIRRSAIAAIGGYAPTYYCAEDVDLFLRLAEVGLLANLNDMLLQYRQHVESIGYSKRNEQLHAAWRAACDAYTRRQLQNTPPEPDIAEATKLNDHREKWAWWALMEGNLTVARKYAVSTLCRRPLRIGSWRLMACVLRGY